MSFENTCSEQSGDALKNISRSVDEVNKRITTIAGSMDKQAHNVSEIRESLQNMDTMSQQNAAMVEELSASAELVNASAEKMLKRVEVFDIKE